jgi:hypothetical protein
MVATTAVRLHYGRRDFYKMAKFCFPTLEGAAFFAATHTEAIGVHVETVAHFNVFFVTMRTRAATTKFHDRIAN